MKWFGAVGVFGKTLFNDVFHVVVFVSPILGVGPPP